MPQAKIEIDGVAGSELNATIDTMVQLSNLDVGGEVTYTWAIVDQPPGGTDSPSSTVIENPTFTPTREGTYLIRLTVNIGLANEVANLVVLSVVQMKTLQRVPAAGETTEASTSRGWANSVGDMLLWHDNLIGRGTTIVAEADDTHAYGDICTFLSAATLKAGLVGEENVPLATKALANDATKVVSMLGICLGRVDGNSSASVGEMARYLVTGVFVSPAAFGAPGDKVFVSDTAELATTMGTERRVVGTILVVGGADTTIMFDGLKRATLSPQLFAADASGLAATSLALVPNSQTPVAVGDAWRITAPVALTCVGMSVYITDALHDDAIDFTLYVGGGPSALAVSMPATTADGFSVVDGITISAGDFYYVVMDVPVLVTEAEKIAVTLLFETPT